MKLFVKQNRFRSLTIATSWIWFILLALIPITLTLMVSFCTRDYYHLFKLPLTLTSYQQMLRGGYFLIILRSLKLAFSCTFLAILIGYPFAYLIARSSAKWQPVLFLLVIVPFWISSLVRIYAIMLILKHHGLLNYLLMRLGVIQKPLTLLYSNAAVVAGTTYDLLPLMIMPIYLSIHKINSVVIEAARDLGAKNWAIFWRIIVPLSKDGIMNGIYLVFLPSITLFYIPVLLGGSKELLLGNLIQNQFLVFNNWPMGAALGSSLTLVITLAALGRWWYQSLYQ